MSGEIERGGIADKALQLVIEMKRNPDVLPPYNADLVRNCLHKIEQLYDKNSRDVIALRSGETQDHSRLSDRLTAIYQIRRCLCAYINARKERIKSFRWKFGGVLPASVKNALCDAELEFFNKYCNSLASFQASLGDSGVNLLLNAHPPKKLFVKVRALENHGEFETSDGSVVMLLKGTLHSLPRQDCEMLIRQGVLEVSN